jgi:alpha-tubulin suppressor-like RCC1 family protein
MLLRLCFVFAIAVAILAGHFTHADSELRIISVSAGDRHTCALASNGAVRCWGLSDSGQTGDPKFRRVNSDPAQMPLLATDAYQVVAGRDVSCFISRSQGLECVGQNDRGQLGARNPGRISNHPVPVSGFTAGLASVVLGDAHACALTRQGGVECWGSGEQGQLGTASGIENFASQQAGTVESAEPGHVLGLANGIMKVASGSVHSCAVTARGGVKCWGGNSFGQLGIGSHQMRATPTDVIGLGSNVAQIALGFSHTCALLRSGAVECWGSGSHGQVGDGADEERLAPHAVKGLPPGVSQLAAGADHTCALVRDGTVRCWGQNQLGQLGDGGTAASAVPTKSVKLPAKATQLTAGGGHTCALLATGALYCWGSNAEGQLGQTTLSVYTQPVEVPFPFPAAQGLNRAGETHL